MGDNRACPTKSNGTNSTGLEPLTELIKQI